MGEPVELEHRMEGSAHLHLLLPCSVKCLVRNDGPFSSFP